MRVGRVHLSVGLVLASALVACVYDPHHRCGADRHLVGELCICNPGLEDRSGFCVDPNVDASVPGLGIACNNASDCSSSDYPLCHIDKQVPGYCTRSCSDASDTCEADFFCTNDGYCRRQPTGQGQSCTSDDDCKGFDADYCAIGQIDGATCLVSNCTDTGCAPGWVCLDLSTFGFPPVCTQQ